MKKPDLTKIENKMESGKDFTITREQYLKLTGADIPQKKSYTEKDSAVAKRAKKMGYTITVIPEKLVFSKKL